MIVGLLSGSLTSTPAFSAAKDTVATEYVNAVAVGHGIAYLFGVVGVVLFVQLIPKLTKANMDEERAKLVQVSEGEEKTHKKPHPCARNIHRKLSGNYHGKYSRHDSRTFSAFRR